MKYAYLTIFSLVVFSSFGQTINNLFVNSTENIVRLDYSSTPPTVTYLGFGSGATIGEGIAHIENSQGEVILLVNSSGVYDRDGNKMPGSNGIFAHPSSTEIVICRKPGSEQLFYVIYNNQLCSSLFYSLVDLSKRNGLGDVVELNKVIDNQNQYAEGLEIVTIPCSSDYYLLSYRCYTGITKTRITANGFSQPELIYALNTGNHGGRGELDYHRGRIGYAITFKNKAFVADFDSRTGAVTNPQTITFPATNGIYGLEFSPEGKRMFATDLDNRNFLGQVSSPNLFSYSFETATTTSWTLSNSGGSCTSTDRQGLGQIEIGKDRKLYIPVIGGCNIYVVEDPDENPSIAVIETSSVLSTGISDHIQSDFLGESVTPSPTIAADDDDLVLCPEQQITLQTEDLSGLEYQWYKDDQIISGANAPVLELSAPGKYYVYVENETSCGKNSSSITIEATSVQDFDLGENQSICPGESVHLEVPSTNADVIWSDGMAEGSRTISVSGEYTVTVSQGDCSESDSIVIHVLDTDPENVYNIITPNGDEYNEYFVIPEAEENYSFEVYNRWGHQVFSDLHYKSNWNGNGLPNGVYFFLLKGEKKCLNYKGWVQLIR
jgi:gliding motility-associated-like protein